jgi:hypothetical protein
VRIRLGRDHAKRIQRVAYLMTLHGVLEIVTAAVVAAFLPIPHREDGEAVVRAAQRALLLPAAAALCGLLKVVAGRLNSRYRARSVGMAALLSGPVALGTVACFPTALALTAYGLWVYSHPAVRRAFALRAAGTFPGEIEAILRSPGGEG